MTQNSLFTQREKDTINNNLYQAGLSIQETIHEVGQVYTDFQEPESLHLAEAILLCDSMIKTLKELVEFNGRSASPPS